MTLCDAGPTMRALEEIVDMKKLLVTRIFLVSCIHLYLSSVTSFKFDLSKICHQRDEHPDYCSDIENFLPRNISLQRSTTSEQLGFNIRGGKEHNCGIYISKVMRNSEADRLGLQEGDQIIAVNDVNFESIDHGEVMTEHMTKVDTHLNRAPLPVDNTELNYIGGELAKARDVFSGTMYSVGVVIKSRNYGFDKAIVMRFYNNTNGLSIHNGEPGLFLDQIHCH